MWSFHEVLFFLALSTDYPVIYHYRTPNTRAGVVIATRYGTASTFLQVEGLFVPFWRLLPQQGHRKLFAQLSRVCPNLGFRGVKNRYQGYGVSPSHVTQGAVPEIFGMPEKTWWSCVWLPTRTAMKLRKNRFFSSSGKGARSRKDNALFLSAEGYKGRVKCRSMDQVCTISSLRRTQCQHREDDSVICQKH